MALAWSTTCGHRGLTGSGGKEPPAKGKAESQGLALPRVRLSGHQGVWGQRPCGAEPPELGEPRSLESLTPWRASLLGEPYSSVSLGWGTAQCPQAPPNPPDPLSVPTHPLTRHGGRRAQVEACSSRRAGCIQCPGSEAVLPFLSGSRGSGVCPSTSRNGSWWEKSQHSLSATGGGWEEGEEGYECLTQIKQPKKNKGRKQPEAMASIFFQVNFPPPPLPLSPPGGGKIGACGGEWLHGEIFPCLCHVSPLPVTPLCRLRGAAPTVPLFSPGIPSAT